MTSVVGNWTRDAGTSDEIRCLNTESLGMSPRLGCLHGLASEVKDYQGKGVSLSLRLGEDSSRHSGERAACCQWGAIGRDSWPTCKIYHITPLRTHF